MRVTLSGCSMENSAQKSATAFCGGGGVLPLAGVPLGRAGESLISARIDGKASIVFARTKCSGLKANYRSSGAALDLIEAPKLPAFCGCQYCMIGSVE